MTKNVIFCHSCKWQNVFDNDIILDVKLYYVKRRRHFDDFKYVIYKRYVCANISFAEQTLYTYMSLHLDSHLIV